MNKKLIFVLQIEVDDGFEGNVRKALNYFKERVESLVNGHVKMDEVKLQD
jgi:hypothetical protein